MSCVPLTLCLHHDLWPEKPHALFLYLWYREWGVSCFVGLINSGLN